MSKSKKGLLMTYTDRKGENRYLVTEFSTDKERISLITNAVKQMRDKEIRDVSFLTISLEEPTESEQEDTDIITFKQEN